MWGYNAETGYLPTAANMGCQNQGTIENQEGNENYIVSIEQ